MTGPGENSDEKAGESSALDNIFHDSNFKEYEPEALIPLPPARPIDAAEPTSRLLKRPPATELTSTHRTLFWVAGAMIAAIILVILFVIGTKTAPQAAPAAAIKPTASATVTPSPTPTPTVTPAVPAGPAAVGVHKWSELRGGECLSPYDSPWAESFTVVDCTTPHAAQLVHRAAFPPASAGASTSSAIPWPGESQLAAQINVLCTAPGVIDLAVAGTYSDIQFQGSYAASAPEWASGNHSYSCFVSRSSGQPLTASVAGAH
jgi:hypothetical protein